MQTLTTFPFIHTAASEHASETGEAAAAAEGAEAEAEKAEQEVSIMLVINCQY